MFSAYHVKIFVTLDSNGKNKYVSKFSATKDKVFEQTWVFSSSFKVTTDTNSLYELFMGLSPFLWRFCL